MCQLDEEGQALVKAAIHPLGMNAQPFHRILRLVRALADQAGSERIETAHMVEAIQTGLCGRVEQASLFVGFLV